MRKLLPLTLTMLLLLPFQLKNNKNQAVLAENIANESIANFVENFKNPQNKSRPMIRYWIPEAAVEIEELNVSPLKLMMN